MKAIYKIPILLIIFIASLIFFGRSIPSLTSAAPTASKLQSTVFPSAYILSHDQKVNPLKGYSTRLSSGLVRESISPVGSDKKLILMIDPNKTGIEKLDYTLLSIPDDKELVNGQISAFESTGTETEADLFIDYGMKTSTEYGLRICITTDTNKKIYYYTRIKYYDSDIFLDEKLGFVNKFHDAAIGTNTDLDMTKYLETDPDKADDTSLALVDMYSDPKLIRYNDLKPEVISEITPYIKELNIETAAVLLKYYIRLNGKSTDKNEVYQVKEFFRVRYVDHKIYLLYYRRAMESIYNPSFTSIDKNELKIGVTSNSNIDLKYDKTCNEFAFVRNGSLFSYDIEANNITRIFSFEQNNKDYYTNDIDQHDVKILKLNDNGDIDFIVYGYMSSGDYEGQVAIILYKYVKEDNQLNERVYIPLHTTYQRLRQDLGNFCYINEQNIFYFAYNNVAIAYNIPSKKYEVLSNYATEDNFAMINSTKSFIITNGNKDSYADTITILNLDTTEKYQIKADKRDRLRVLGIIDKYLIYGCFHEEDAFEASDGRLILPVYKMIIADSNGKTVREYDPGSDRYISSIKVKYNVIHINRIKRKRSTFVSASEDSMIKNNDEKENTVSVYSRVTNEMLTEKYITISEKNEITNVPEELATKQIMVNEDTTLHINEDQASSEYYIYAYGEITGKVDNAGDGVMDADEEMGVLTDGKGAVIWERGGQFNSKDLTGLETVRTAESVSSALACTSMLLKYAQVDNASDISGTSIMDDLSKHLETPVNLTGCNVSEMLYFISNGRPVIAMSDPDKYVLITAYTLSDITWFDPGTGRFVKMSQAAADTRFKGMGNVFISYI